MSVILPDNLLLFDTVSWLWFFFRLPIIPGIWCYFILYYTTVSVSNRYYIAILLQVSAPILHIFSCPGSCCLSAVFLACPCRRCRFFQPTGGSGGLGAGEFPLVKIFPPKWRPKTVRKRFYVPPKLTMSKHRLTRDKRNSQQQILHFSKVGFSDKPLAIEYQWIADFTFRVCFALTSHLTCDIL